MCDADTVAADESKVVGAVCRLVLGEGSNGVMREMHCFDPFERRDPFKAAVSLRSSMYPFGAFVRRMEICLLHRRSPSGSARRREGCENRVCRNRELAQIRTLT